MRCLIDENPGTTVLTRLTTIPNNGKQQYQTTKANNKSKQHKTAATNNITKQQKQTMTITQQ